MVPELPKVLADDGKQDSLHRDESLEGQAVIKIGERRFIVPSSLLIAQPDGTYRLPYKVANLPSEEVIPLVEEQLEVTKLEHTNQVKIHKTVSEREETVRVPLEATEVEVNRVEIRQPVDTPPGIRTEGDTTIIPVLTEQVVVTKQLILEAEIHVTKKSVTDTFQKTLTLKQEEVKVEHSEGEAAYVNGKVDKK